MKYILVLQWPASVLADYEELVRIEDALIGQLPNTADVDGHDIGTGEMNVFVRTDDPRATFKQIANILGRESAWAHLRAAYRSADGDTYTPLWPSDLREFGVA